MKTKNKILKYVTCGVLAAMTAVTATFVGVSCKKENKAELPNIPLEDKVYDANGNEMQEDTFYAMPQSMTFAPRAAVMAASIDSVMTANVTATITPSDAANKLVDWSVAFKNASSTWASGKTVTDYVTVTPTSSGSLSATVTCKQAFGEQIVMTVTSRDNTSAKASCTLDYKQQFLGYAITVSGNNTVTADYTTSSMTGLKVNLDSTQKTVIMPSYKKSTVYTIARGDSECPQVGKIEVTMSAALSSALKAVKDGAQTLTVPSDPSNTPMDLFNKTWLESLSLTAAQKNSVITAIKNNASAGALTITFKSSSGTTLDSWMVSLDTSNLGSIGVTGITLDKSTIVFE